MSFMEKNPLVAPVLKWVGGKRQLLPALAALMPGDVACYCEPFVGGGALLFNCQPSVARINDINAELITIYPVIREDVEALITELSRHGNEAKQFYAVRDWDRNRDAYSGLSPVQRAARILYLNKTCYNGLYRVNAAGEFNTPYGRYKNPNIVNAGGLRAVSAYFNTADIRFSCLDYAAVLDDLPDNAFVYLDLPYDPVSDTANFSGYAQGGFDRKAQIRLRDCCDALNRRGIRFMLSNSATDFIRELYARYAIITVRAKRAINAVSSGRGAVDEVIVRNYERKPSAVHSRGVGASLSSGKRGNLGDRDPKGLCPPASHTGSRATMYFLGT